MQFQVPQFIEMEDTIFGPLTFKQFLYLAGGAGLCFIWYVYLPFFISIFLILGTGGLVVSLAFYKYNGRSFIFILESFIKYVFTKKLYLWKQGAGTDIKKTEVVSKVMAGPEGANLPRLSASKLKDLSWSLDVQGNPENKEEYES
ncbi:MAG: PrgI family protein [Candidatus Paceibacterota bacterium]|jgi:hypothetical protein